MNRLSIFTFGYYGWGNHTHQLVEAVDAVETSRGFNPPIFVDIRIRRSVRAAGFSGTAFERLLGQDRHRWMQSLGNKFIETRIGPKIQIAEPKSADELLDIAVESARHKQRLLYFCSCQWPKWDGKVNCHRTTVAALLLKAARRRGVKIEIVEWPGGDPKHIEMEVTSKEFAAVRKGRMALPMSKRGQLAEIAVVPWYSIATLHSDGEKLHRLVGPAVPKTSGWVLPVWDWFYDPTTGLTEYKRQAKKLRKDWYLDVATGVRGR